METPGLLLKREREARGLTIAELARITRISETALENIEKNAVDEFPAQVFVRGFLRNYARQLSIPAEEIMESYDAWMRQSNAQVATPSVVEVAQIAPANYDEEVASQATQRVPEHSMRFAYVAILFIAIASVGLSLLFMGTGEAEEGDVDFMIQPNAAAESPFLISNGSQGWVVE